MNSLQKMLQSMVATVIMEEKNLTEQVIDTHIDQITQLPLFSSLTGEEADEVKNSLKSQFSIKLDKGILIEESHHERWFLGRKHELDMKYWERYKKHLIDDKHFSINVVNTMDDILDTQVDLLGDPMRDISYSRRGLIIGDVQSGKTANYTGLICKAVDAGYKVIVLMTGILEKLRQQTQQRIDEGFVGADSDAMMNKRENGLIIGVGKHDPSIRPMVLTSTCSDFKAQNARNLGFDLRSINGPVIFVVKKNVSILKRLNSWLTTANLNGESHLNQSLLVIDDEADNASVNTNSNDEDTNPTAINGQIRTLLKIFTKSSYVGFTATPFANIFIDPDSNDRMEAEDLFPKDYIYSLDAPSNYIGARNIFSENGNANYMLVEIDNNVLVKRRMENCLPIKHKSTYQVKDIPEDMETAIETFLLANTIQDLRMLDKSHRSMLINVSRFTNVQNQVAILVMNYLKELQAAIKVHSSLSVEKALNDPYMKKLHDTYHEIYKAVNDFTWSDIQPNLYKACASIKVVVINKDSSQSLNYDEYNNTGLRVIAVGGMSLSRGLTLEGLVVSYFYRNSRMYDTLMQMGRWFGYRSKYEDLCRIWMTDESIRWYEHISFATDELRQEIKRYHDSDMTPLDFGLRVRSDINTLLVTAKNKMRSASSVECAISLSGVVIETPELYSDVVKNDMNIALVKNWYNKVVASGHEVVRERNRVYGFKNIPLMMIKDLLENIEISPKNEQFNVESLNDFFYEYAGDELKEWDVAFAVGTSENEMVLDENVAFHYPRRSYSFDNNGKIIKMSKGKRRLGTTEDGRLFLSDDDIKTIKEKNDKISQKSYFNTVKRKPLLMIYFVELIQSDDNLEYKHISEKYAISNNRPMVGFGIGIPSLSNQETKYAKYVINKVLAQQMFDYEDEGELGDD